MTNTTFRLCGCIGYGTLPDGTVFLFDADQLDRIGNTKWYRCHNKKYDLRGDLSRVFSAQKTEQGYDYAA